MTLDLNVAVGGSAAARGPAAASGGSAGGGGGGNTLRPSDDPERQVAMEIRTLLSRLTEKMEEARELKMRVNFSIPQDQEGRFTTFSSDIVKVLD